MNPNAAGQAVWVDARQWGSVEMTARDWFEVGLPFFGIAVWRTSPSVTSETAWLHGAHTAWVTGDEEHHTQRPPDHRYPA
jgi:hypothetical protein